MGIRPYTIGGTQPGGAGASPRDAKSAITVPHRLSSEGLNVLAKQAQENSDSQVMQLNRVLVALGQIIDLAQGRIIGILAKNTKKVTSRGLETVYTEPVVKTTTGDPTGYNKALYINEYDNVAKLYADGAWRTLAHWPVHRQTRSYSFTSSGVGAGIHYVGGYYNAPVSAVTLIDDGIREPGTQTLGRTDLSYAAHAFVVASGAGIGVLTVTGTSITDGGVRTTSDSEVIIADASTASTDDYFETSKKWLGRITYTLTGTDADFTFNYGYCKYDDWGNVDFKLVDFECVGIAGATDTDFDIELLHHGDNAWTYSAAAFVPGSSTIAQMTTDHSTESNLFNGASFAYKRDNLNTEIPGSASEGYLIRITTAQNNTVQSMNCIVGIE